MIDPRCIPENCTSKTCTVTRCRYDERDWAVKLPVDDRTDVIVSESFLREHGDPRHSMRDE